MKRVLALSLMLGLSSFGLAGCGEKTEHSQTETITTPGGKTEKEVKETIKSTGDNPPPTTSGETGGTAAPTAPK